MSTPSALSKPTIAFHWIVAIAIIGMLAFGLYLEDLPRSPEKGELMGLHKSFGVLVLMLASLRIVWRVKEGPIPAIGDASGWQEKMAKGIHHLLLLATILMPVSGIMMSVGGGRGLDVFGVNLIAAGEKIEWLGQLGGATHGVLAKIMIAAILLHVLGAIKHHVLMKDNTLTRMLGKS